MRYLIVKWLFKILYSGYQFPFDKLNDRLFKMKEVSRKNYYQTARELKENKVYNDILEESIRKMYQKLSVSSANKNEQTAYRATLIWIQQDFTQVINKLAMSFNDNPPKINLK